MMRAKQVTINVTEKDIELLFDSNCSLSSIENKVMDALFPDDSTSHNTDDDNNSIDLDQDDLKVGGTSSDTDDIDLNNDSDLSGSIVISASYKDNTPTIIPDFWTALRNNETDNGYERGNYTYGDTEKLKNNK